MAQSSLLQAIIFSAKMYVKHVPFVVEPLKMTSKGLNK
jgi:hypothetical protein